MISFSDKSILILYNPLRLIRTQILVNTLDITKVQMVVLIIIMTSQLK